MNKYIIPWTDLDIVDNLKINAKSYNDCKEKIIEHFAELYDFIDDTMTYQEMVECLDKHDILLGHTIEDVEEL